MADSSSAVAQFFFASRVRSSLRPAHSRRVQIVISNLILGAIANEHAEGRPFHGPASCCQQSGRSHVMMKLSDAGPGLARCLGLAAAAMLALSAAPGERAEARSLINPGAVPAAKYASGGLTTEVRGGHGGHGGGGFRGGSFHGGGSFRGGGAAFHGGGFRTGHVIHGGGFRHGGFGHHHRHHFHRRFHASYYDDYPYY